MLNKTGVTGNDGSWQKSVPPVKPVAPVPPAAGLARQPGSTDTTRFIQSAHVAEGLLYTEAMIQTQERRAQESSLQAQQEAHHHRSLADLPYLASPELAAYKKTAAEANPLQTKTTGGSGKGQKPEHRKLFSDNTGMWVAAAFVAVCVVVVKWLF